MIITAFLTIIYNFILLILSPLSLLGDVSLNPGFASALTTAGGYYNSLNSILPVDTMLAIFGVSLTIEGAYLVYKIIMWVLSKIPGIN